MPPAAKTTAKADAKAAAETDEAKWERDEAERAAKAKEAAAKEQDRRAKLSTDELRADDRKKEVEGEKERARIADLTPAERNAELDKSEPLPPWQKRLSNGKVFDARTQPRIVLVASDGTAIEGADRDEARAFFFEYLTEQAKSK